ncbi:MAG: PQQ-binding-like beta-propeller repeat protein [Phycisphaerae bacterium]|nr:PQQ-binding-like beta-propeller repeat protein [Phycisphaerae bacterium]
MKRATIPACSALILLGFVVQSWAQMHEMKDLPASTPQEIIAASGVKGGLIVHSGRGGAVSTADFVLNDSFLVHGLYRGEAAVAQARAHIKKKGLYGQVSVQYWDKDYLPYADNMVNLLVAESLIKISREEVMRVLVPLGVAYIGSDKGWHRIVKPWPGEIDEWTHFLHGPDNNAVAHDTVVGVPKHVQWIGHPKFARSHEQLASVSAMVSAKGRIFTIVDEGLTADIRMPARWRLVARDAFNGVVLWKRTIDKWSDHLHGFRSGPPDLPFRLVAVGNRVYVPLGSDKPVTALDAATGEVVMTFKGSEHTRQIIHTGNRLIMLTGTSQVAIHMNPERKESARRSIMAADVETGGILWRKETSKEMLLPLVVSGDALLYQTSKHLVCLKLTSGDEKWRIAHPVHLANPKNRMWQWASPTLTAHNGIVYVADFRSLSAISVDNGKALWECSSRQGFCSPPDIFVIDELLWRGYTPQRGRADFGEGLDARTGRVAKTIVTDKAWTYATLAHFRCYRAKATSRFILSSRSGVEFIDLESGKINLNHWVRGTCQYGIMPCNGLLYAPPHSCACNIKTMFRGMCALAPAGRGEKGEVGRVKVENRLIRGPAYGSICTSHLTLHTSSDWPTFRHDNERSGRTPSEVPSDLRRVWETEIGGRLSSPVTSRGKVFVSEIDAHTVHALDATDGVALWSFTANGRIDSAPTFHDGMVIFGSVDGRVYCVRATDGALVWRFRCAPKNRRIVVHGQLESAWPVHGSVLVNDGALIVAAGRSSYLDGGIHIYRLDPRTGRKLSETVVHSPDPKTGDQLAGGVDLRGVLNDILTVCGESVYMRHLKINFETGDDLQIGPPHLFAPMGFLDDDWWHRSYWIFGSDPVCMPPVNESGWQIWPRVGNMVPSGRILSVSEEMVFGYGRDKYPGGMAGQIRGGEKYHLFATEKKALEPLPSYKDKQHLRSFRSGQALGLEVTERDKQHGAPSLHRNLWSRPSPIFVRALVLADTTLFLAGPPEPDDTKRGELMLDDAGKAEAVFVGRQGASLCAVAAADGRQLAEYKLESLPVFDGMIAARGQLFVSLQNGSLVCFGE